MKKSYKLVPLLLIVTLTLTSCIIGHHEKTNYYRKYKSFLKYSLGDIESVEKEKVKHSGGAPIPTYGSFYKWQIKYKDVNGNENIFTLINNIDNFSKNVTHDEFFANQIFSEATKITEEQIKEEVLYKYYDKLICEYDSTVSGKRNTTNYYFWITNVYENEFDFKGEVEFSKPLIDKKTGVKLSEVTPQIMVSDYGYEYYFKFSTYNENQDEIEKEFELYKQVISEVAEYLNQEIVPLRFHSSHNEAFKCEGKYIKSTKQFEFK